VKGFLLDENLPGLFLSATTLPVLHVRDLGPSRSDSEVWTYAQVNDLVITTKDADFANRIMMSGPPPKVIHLRIGNMRLAEFNAFVDKVWPTVLTLIRDHKLVNVYPTRYETVA
jgi:predicted nuclease of predicted toxin-antitoxin system